MSEPAAGEDRDRPAGRRRISPLRTVLWVLVVLAVVVTLFTWVFPWVESLQQDPTIGAVQALLDPR